MERRLSKIILVSLILAALMSSVSVFESVALLDDPPETPAWTPIPLPTQLYNLYGSGPDNFPPSVNPLTGQVVADPSLLDRRPLAVKISNYPRSVRPQSGLSRADTVYEYYLEKGITRFIGIFYGQDVEKAGPVRSARFFDEHIFQMYAAVFIFSGADDRILDHFMELEKSTLGRLLLEHPEDLKQACRPGKSVPLCRDRRLAGYNNLFTNTHAASESLTARGRDNQRPELSGLRFDRYVPVGGSSGAQVEFVYSSFSFNRWVYLPASGRYIRFQDVRDHSAAQGALDAPLLDSLTNEVIAADNVVALFVPHTHYLNTPTTEIVKINLYGSGQAYLFRDGQAFPAGWVRPADGLFSLLTPTGNPLPLKPGVTFYQVIGQTSIIQQESDTWLFEFRIP
jgi:hypothetical protein